MGKVELEKMYYAYVEEKRLSYFANAELNVMLNFLSRLVLVKKDIIDYGIDAIGKEKAEQARRILVSNGKFYVDKLMSSLQKKDFKENISLGDLEVILKYCDRENKFVNLNVKVFNDIMEYVKYLEENYIERLDQEMLANIKNYGKVFFDYMRKIDEEKHLETLRNSAEKMLASMSVR